MTKKYSKWIWGVPLWILAIAFLAPFAWMISTALKPDVDAYKIPMQWIPNPFQWDNFSTVLSRGDLGPAGVRPLGVRGAAAGRGGADHRDDGRLRVRPDVVQGPGQVVPAVPGDGDHSGPAAARSAVHLLPETRAVRHALGADPAGDVHRARNVPDAPVLRQPAGRVRRGGPDGRRERVAGVHPDLLAVGNPGDERARHPRVRLVLERLRDATGADQQPGPLHAAAQPDQLRRRTGRRSRPA